MNGVVSKSNEETEEKRHTKRRHIHEFERVATQGNIRLIWRYCKTVERPTDGTVDRKISVYSINTDLSLAMALQVG
jgi:hypothetical protein